MAHSERIGEHVIKNIIGEKDQKIFESGVNLKSISYVALSLKSTYWVAIWPFAINCLITSSLATNLPSPWDIAILWVSPTSVAANHGDLFEAILVLTI